ncbi:DUF4192 family protein [Microbacterium sp. NPDC091313]
MTTVIRAAGAADFLALVPHLVGFHPARSIVLVPFEGSRSIGALRFDLPPADLPDDARDQLAATAIGMVCKVAHADAMAVVVYSDDPVAPRALPADAVVAAVLARADMCGVRVVDALCVGADGWARYLEPDAVHPPLAVADPPEALGGERPAGDQLAGSALPAVDLAEKERVGVALREIERAMSGLFGDAAAVDGRRLPPGALAAVCRMDDVPLLFEEAIEHEPAHLDPYDAAALVWCLSRPALRDVALMQWAADLDRGDEVYAAQTQWQVGEEYPEHLAAPMWGDGPAPDPDRLARALALTRRVAAAAPRAHRPGVLAAAAWLAWATGRSTHAAAYCARALEIEPDHGLATLVLQMADAAYLPEWVYRRPGSARRSAT